MKFTNVTNVLVGGCAEGSCGWVSVVVIHPPDDVQVCSVVAENRDSPAGRTASSLSSSQVLRGRDNARSLVRAQSQ
jgi:xanthine dehydrogenase iron-sulfur cluster and FAD-binding subunit A